VSKRAMPSDLGRVINAAGPITPLGAGVLSEPVIATVAEVLRESVDMGALQAFADSTIRQAFEVEAGCIVGCTAAGIAIAVAATMTGQDRVKVEQLPDTRGMKDVVLLQQGHDCWFGAWVRQMIQISGARLAYVGTETRATEADLARALSPDTAAAVFVASHHTVAEGMIPLEVFVAHCARADVPVIVDAAGSVDPTIYLTAGAALVLISAHKNFGGATAGIIAGRPDLVAACQLQEAGIGRAMKVGKEGIVGAIAGLQQWHAESSSQREERWRTHAKWLCSALAGSDGIRAELETDPPEHRITRARIQVDRSIARVDAREVAARLRKHQPPIRVWEAGLDDGYFALDPRCLSASELEIVASEVKRAVLSPRMSPPP
jgi:uncharacterized pyridoxal phosphate-dependent enzyme